VEDIAARLLPLMDPDGPLVELRAAMAGEEDWRRVVDLLRTSAAMVDFSVDDLPRPLPAAFLPLFDGGPALLSCRVSGILLDVRFTAPVRLEIKIDPREVDARRVDGFGRFWMRLADVLQREVSFQGLAYDPRAKRFDAGTGR
jgi:hypothetical protein